MNQETKQSEGRYLEWTPELVARFWDYWAISPTFQDQYFTFQIGAEIANFLTYVSDLPGRRILDYGCGPGYLVEHLIQRGASVAAADYSAESVKKVNERFANREGWEGAVQIDDGTIVVQKNQFDIITCVETIEHMFERDQHKMLAEFRRVLKPHGRVMFTTPNNEDLRRTMIFCPQCVHAFHNMQHLCSWNKESLTNFLREEEFAVDFCEGVDLRRWGGRDKKALIDLSLRDVLRNVRDLSLDAYGSVADRMFPRSFPNGRMFQRLVPTYRPMHLVAIASKK